MDERLDIRSEREENKRVPSEKAWKNVLSNALAGNDRFPQAFFAQGIRVASSMSTEATREDVPLWQFFAQNAPQELVIAKLEHGKEKAHARYGIRTQRSDTYNNPVVNVWDSGRRHARSVINNMARLVQEDENRDTDVIDLIPARYIDDAKSTTAHELDTIQKLQHDPLFQGLLSAAAKGLQLDEVTELSHEYKDAIATFMSKYPPGLTEYDFGQYTQDRTALDGQLHSIALQSLGIVKTHVQEWVQEQHPQSTELQSKIAKADPRGLFCELAISTPDPLRLVY